MLTLNILNDVPKEFYNRIFLFSPHCDLGDNIICKGIVNEIIDKYDYIIIPIFEHYRKSMEHLYNTTKCILVEERIINDMLYQDNYPYFTGNNVLILGLKLNRTKLPEKYRNIYKKFMDGNITFSESYYVQQANLSYDVSYNKFSIYKRDIEEENKLLEKYKDCDVFFHEDYPRRYLIKDKYKIGKYIFPDRNLTNNVFNWIPVIQKCTEIHCIDSCFLNLIDRIKLNPNVRLYYHAYAKKSMRPALRKNWKIIEN